MGDQRPNIDLRVIDVRSGNERLAGKVPGAIELVFGPVQWTERAVSDEDIVSFLSEIRKRFPEKETRMIVFCNIGVRSRAAGIILSRDGYTKVIAVKDGFLGNRFGPGLEAAGF